MRPVGRRRGAGTDIRRVLGRRVRLFRGRSRSGRRYRAELIAAGVAPRSRPRHRSGASRDRTISRSSRCGSTVGILWCVAPGRIVAVSCGMDRRAFLGHAADVVRPRALGQEQQRRTVAARRRGRTRPAGGEDGAPWSPPRTDDHGRPAGDPSVSPTGGSSVIRAVRNQSPRRTRSWSPVCQHRRRPVPTSTRSRP